MSRFIPLTEALKMGMLGNLDMLQRDKGRYMMWSKQVWYDLNLQSLKIAKRELLCIDKRTNSVQMPCDFMQLCSVNVVCNGVIIPVYFNDNIKNSDIVEVSAAQNCACQYKCGYQLCNTIQGYEAIQSVQSDFLPNGQPISFNCITRMAVDANGFLYRQTQYPLRVYLSGVWTDTILYTENEKLCNLELDNNGCVCDTENNYNNVCNSCCGNVPIIPTGGSASTPPCDNPQTNTWRYYCSSKADLFLTQCGGFPRGFGNGCYNTYNISELGNRLIFPNNFGFDKVLVRYYADVNLGDLQIPFVALDTFIIGVKWWDAKYNDEKQELAEVYEQQYAKMKFGLLLELNKYRMAEMRMILTPKVYVPSFYSWRNNNQFGNGGFNNGWWGYSSPINNS
jgi:hypothetical protein